MATLAPSAHRRTHDSRFWLLVAVVGVAVVWGFAAGRLRSDPWQDLNELVTPLVLLAFLAGRSMQKRWLGQIAGSSALAVSLAVFALHQAWVYGHSPFFFLPDELWDLTTVVGLLLFPAGWFGADSRAEPAAGPYFGGWSFLLAVPASEALVAPLLRGLSASVTALLAVVTLVGIVMAAREVALRSLVVGIAFWTSLGVAGGWLVWG